MNSLNSRFAHAPATVAAGLFCLSGAVADVPAVSRLNSERIEAQFGSYGVEVLFQSDHCRMSDLYSADDDQNITRTLAIVALPERVTDSLTAAHKKIRAGASLGSTLKAHGWTVHKQPVWVGELPASAGSGWLGRRMNLEKGIPLAAQAYQLGVSKAGEEMVYVNILEIYHPEYVDHELDPPPQLASNTPLGRWADVGLVNQLFTEWQPEANTPSIDPCDIGLPVAPQL